MRLWIVHAMAPRTLPSTPEQEAPPLSGLMGGGGHLVTGAQFREGMCVKQEQESNGPSDAYPPSIRLRGGSYWKVVYEKDVFPVRRLI